jgi:nucleoside 2-deoxyribosyltransferase
VRIYWAAPLFSQVQRAWNRAMASRLEAAAPGVAVVLPQDFRPAGRFNDVRCYGAIFQRCLEEIRRCDAMVAVLDGADVDAGVAFEMGVAHALGRPIVGVRTDFRPGAEHGVNLVCSRACRYLVREFAFQESLETVAAALARRLQGMAKTRRVP